MDLDLDLDIPKFDEDDEMLPPPEPFPLMAPQAPAEPGFLRSSSEAHQGESSESAEAPARRRPRVPRVLGMDEQKALRNADLASWNNNYITNMVAATKVKQQHKLPTLAKKNAAFWVYGAGINDAGTGIGASKLVSPLDMFAGDNLIGTLTGATIKTAGRKRSYTEEADRESDSEARRVRTRDTEDDLIGRGDNLILPNDETLPVFDDDVSSPIQSQSTLPLKPTTEYRNRPPRSTSS